MTDGDAGDRILCLPLSDSQSETCSGTESQGDRWTAADEAEMMNRSSFFAPEFEKEQFLPDSWTSGGQTEGRTCVRSRVLLHVGQLVI